MGNYKTAKDFFVPKNIDKYIGKMPIIYRSGWELSMMMWLDKHPFVLQWASESMQIPYKNPLTNRWSVYVPDFIVIYADGSGNGTMHTEMVEVKPKKECPGFQPVSKRTGRNLKVSQQTRMAQAVNAAKWEAAMAFCQKNGFKWRVITEESLYNYK